MRYWSIFLDNYRFQNFHTTISLHYTGLPFLFSITKSKFPDYFNSFIDVTHGFWSCVVVVLYRKSVAQDKGVKTLQI